MDIEELMLGNYIGCRGFSVPYGVIECLDGHNRSAVVCLANGERVEIIEEDLRGLPLTEEFFSAAGFSNVMGYQYDGEVSYVNGNIFYTPTDKILHIGERLFVCESVHKLQIAFKITKKQLKINL